MKTITIGNREVGEGQPAFVIAEIGTNHNRQLDTAKELVRASAEAGVDAVKFQIYEADDIVNHQIRSEDYGFEKLYPNQSMHEVFDRRLKTPREWIPELVDLARQLGILSMATAHSRSGAEFIMEQGMCAIKLASMDLNNAPVLQDIAQVAGVPVIFSTGLSELDEIRETVDIFRIAKTPFAILHCVANYPAAFEDLHLQNINALQDMFQVPVGFSDHTSTTFSAATAVALGACMIETHITLDKKSQGPDHSFALEPREFTQLVEAVRQVEKSHSANAGFIGPSDKEREKREIYRRSLVARVTIPAGSSITKEHVKITRPGTGIAPKFLTDLLGRKARQAIPAESPITWEMV